MLTFSESNQDGPEVLHDLTFFVRSGEHIGIGAYVTVGVFRVEDALAFVQLDERDQERYVVPAAV